MSTVNVAKILCISDLTTTASFCAMSTATTMSTRLQPWDIGSGDPESPQNGARNEFTNTKYQLACVYCS